MLNNEEWEEANRKAIGLQHFIKMVFERNPSLEITPWQMKGYLEFKLNKKVNINSTRRCMSNLKNEDVVLILTSTRIGNEGKSEHFYIWKLGNENRKDIKTEKFQVPSIADFAETVIKHSKPKFVQPELFKPE